MGGGLHWGWREGLLAAVGVLSLIFLLSRGRTLPGARGEFQMERDKPFAGQSLIWTLFAVFIALFLGYLWFRGTGNLK